MKHQHKAATLLAGVALAVAAVPVAAQDPFPTSDVALTIWTKDSEADGSLAYAQTLIADYTAMHPNVTIELVQKEVGGSESLRQDFQTASFAGNPPEVLMTVADHVGPFTVADLLLPLDSAIDAAAYLPNALAAVQAGGQTWGVPLSYGNQLMLYYNKDMVAECPADSDAMVAAALANTDAPNGKYGLVYRQDESFWLVPFIGAFNGSVFAEDGVTPNLGSEAMVSALTFLHGLKFDQTIMPSEADYNVMDGLFKDGKAAMVINGDWTLGAYAQLYGDKLGVCPIPKITGADYPRPYTAGEFFMVSKKVGEDADKQAVVTDFITWATDKDNQLAMVDALRRLPGNNEAINDAKVTGDPLLAGAAEAVKLGIPQPTNLEMRCVFDSMNTGIRDLYANASSDPATIAAAMQASAEVGVAPGGECAAE